MTITKNNFFTNDEVLFVGVSRNPKSFSRSVYKDFISAGIKVIPVNHNPFQLNEKIVYKDATHIEQTPECAYILLNKNNTKEAVETLRGRGIKKILFHSKKTVDQETLDRCQSLGIETVIACPKMMVSKMPIHKLHGFVAGVR